MDPFEQGLREAAQNDHQHQTWSPNVGDTLVGRYLGTEQIPTKFGVKPVMKVKDEKTGEVLTVWMNVVLISEFEREAPNMGDRIGITRLEDGKQTRGFPPKRYLLRVDRTAQPARVLRPEAGVTPGQGQPRSMAEGAIAQAPHGLPEHGEVANPNAPTPATLGAYRRLAAHPLLTEQERVQYAAFVSHPQFTETKALAGIQTLNQIIAEREPPALDESDPLPF